MSWQEVENRLKHFYMQTDGTYKFPNSAEGDLLKMVHKQLSTAPIDPPESAEPMLAHLTDKKHRELAEQPVESKDWLDEIFYSNVGLVELDKGNHAGVNIKVKKIRGWTQAKALITHRIEEAKAEAYLLGWNRVPLKSPFNHKSNADGSVDLELSTPKEGAL